MKSRKFTDINSTDANGSAANGLLLARSPRASASGGDVAAGAAVRRFELQHNQSPRFARRRQERRKGQALLLAVLIMLLAALLSAGFLAVVSGNLNQTARIADKTRAIESSRAGIAYANAQLSGSSQGDLWRPVDVSPAPAPGTTGYDFYYSQLDKVQGWANTRAQTDPLYRDTAYGKFPDPNQPVGDAPKFLVQVQELPSNLPVTDADYEHRGEVKITSIGLSDDSPNVFHRAVAYKKGRTQSPWGQAFRSVSNWNFKTNEVPSTKTDNAAAITIAPGSTSAQIEVAERLAPDTELPYNIVIGGEQNVFPLGATVTNQTTDGKTLTIEDYRLPSNDMGTYTIPANVKRTVTLAAAIGTPATLDLFNEGVTPTNPAPDTPAQDQPNGLRVNGSIWLQGQLQVSRLEKSGTKILNSGYLAVSNYSPNTPDPNIKTINVATPPATSNNTDIDNGGFLVSSPSFGFPGTFTTKNGAKKLDLIRDGSDRLKNTVLGLTYTSTDPNTVARDVEPFKPANISSPENVARYRSLARADQGVYVDNTEDVEKVGSAPMSQRDFKQMLLSPKDATEIFTRGKLGDATVPVATATGKSLEEQHIRGWIGKDEFLPRGVLVELLPGAGGTGPFIRVTRDSRDDNTTEPINGFKRATGPVNSKAWFDVNDQNINQANSDPYVKIFPWPSNGTLFAEGNIRVRGEVFGAPNSLTIVSQNNIYIEGSVGIDKAYDPTDSDAVNSTRKKLMLLARKNVVVNPTRLALGHVDVQTRSTGQAALQANNSVQIPVKNRTGFRVGDVIETYSFDPDNPGVRNFGVRGIITGITTDNRLNVDVIEPNPLPTNSTPVAGIPTGSTVGTLLQDNLPATGTLAAPKSAYLDSKQAIARRVLLQTGNNPAQLRLALDHYGISKPAFKVKTVKSGIDPGPGPDAGKALDKPAGLEVFVSNKKSNPFVASNRGLFQVEAIDKVVRGEYNKPTGSPDNFPPAANATYSLANLEAEMDATEHLDLVSSPRGGWKYDTELDGTTFTGADLTTLGQMPFYYLAGVGLRYDPADYAAANRPDPRDPATWLKDIGGTEELSIPLATSATVSKNNLQTTNTPDNAADARFAFSYLGFNPQYAANLPNKAQEDKLTVNKSFYQADTKFSTLDSRRFYDTANISSYSNGDAIALRQTSSITPARAALLPDYRLKAVKLENTTLLFSQPAATVPLSLNINAFVYAQEGSWLVVPGDHFRVDAPVRGLADSNGDIEATYIDYNGNNQADPGEYANGVGNPAIFDKNDYADLNHNGIRDSGELEAVQRFVRYNYQVNFIGAIVENKTAPINGAVSEWMDKWANYDSTITGTNPDGTPISKWKFITYAYDPSIAKNYAGARGLRIPQTDDLIYQQ